MLLGCVVEGKGGTFHSIAACVTMHKKISPNGLAITHTHTLTHTHKHKRKQHTTQTRTD